MFGRVEIADLLISHGAVINASEYRGFTPLHLAAQRGHQAVIVRLIRMDFSKISIVQLTYNATCLL